MRHNSWRGTKYYRFNGQTVAMRKNGVLTIDGETLETTAEHPFYELEWAPWLAVGQTAGRCTDALDLQAGDRVWQADGTSGVVQPVAVAPVQQRMYNLTVAQAHTFFVGDGRGGLCTSVRRTDKDRLPAPRDDWSVPRTRGNAPFSPRAWH